MPEGRGEDDEEEANGEDLGRKLEELGEELGGVQRRAR